MPRKNPYSTDLAYLRDYLKRGFDPADFYNSIESFYEDERDGELPDWVDTDTLWESDFSKMSERDVKDFEDYATTREVDAMTPSTAFFTYEGIVPRTTWLVHFSDHVGKIIDHGIVCGHEEMTELGLTTHFRKKKCHPGWNFAFEWNDRKADIASTAHHGKGKYGNDAVMFQSAGVMAYHSGDEESQIIFWGATVKNIVPLWRNSDGDFDVKQNDSDRVLVTGDYDKVSEWVHRNFKTYWKKIAYVREA